MHKSHLHQPLFDGIDAISIRSDRTFPRHTHDEFGFGYIVDGGQDTWSGRGLVEAQAGDTITVNPAELHDGIGRRGQPRHWHMLFLSPAAIAKFSDIPVASACFTRPVNQSKPALILARNAIQAFTQDDPDRNQTEQLLMLALAAQLEPEQSSNAMDVAHHSADVQTVLDMICQSWDSPLSLEDFASSTKTSKYQILRRFSRELGITPHAYLTQHRVNRARDMIRTGFSLADTAIACGFSDQSHLTRAFSRQLGLTPGNFLRKVAH
jgi:AraC-like DNA-binding protein